MEKTWIPSNDIFDLTHAETFPENLEVTSNDRFVHIKYKLAKFNRAPNIALKLTWNSVKLKLAALTFGLVLSIVSIALKSFNIGGVLSILTGFLIWGGWIVFTNYTSYVAQLNKMEKIQLSLKGNFTTQMITAIGSKANGEIVPVKITDARRTTRFIDMFYEDALILTKHLKSLGFKKMVARNKHALKVK